MRSIESVLSRAPLWAHGTALALAVVVGCSGPDGEGRRGDDVRFDDMAPLAGTAHPDIIAGQYIVVMNDGISTSELSQLLSQPSLAATGNRIIRGYTIINGFAAALDDKGLDEVRKDPRVSFVEADRAIALTAVQDDAPWGLDRIDQRDGTDGKYDDHGFDGSGVHVYVIDTGVRTSHDEFSGRIGDGFSSIDDGGGYEDCNGHGTHVASIAAGTIYGVAKNATIHPVRVLTCNGSGTLSGVIAGLDWVAANHQSPAVANMSLGGSASDSLDNAVANMIVNGVFTAVAAGNDNSNACNYSPARIDAALTVGSANSLDEKASSSNLGVCVNIFAPGRSIIGAWHTSDSASNTISGTSMASPHVIGAGALYLSAFPGANPAEVMAGILDSATNGRLSGIGNGSPNKLLHNDFTSTDPGPDPDPDPDPDPQPDSCIDNCGGRAPGGCYCDSWCQWFGNCCDDYGPICQ